MAAVVLATAGYDHKIRFWEASSRVCTRIVRYPDSQVNCLAISQDKLYMAAGGHPHVRIFDVANPSNSSPIAEFSHCGNVTAVGFQHDRSWMFSGSEDGTVKIWDLRAPPRCQRTYEMLGADGRPSACTSVTLHPRQSELVTGDHAGLVRVWDLAADKCSAELRPTDGELSPIRSVAIASDGSSLVAGTNDVIEAAHEDGSGHTCILKCSISPDAQLLVTTSSDKTAKVWSIARGWTLEKTLAQHQRWVWDASFSADSAYLVTASSDHSARLWDLQSGAAFATTLDTPLL